MIPETINRVGLEQAHKKLLPKKETGLRGGEIQREFLRIVAEDDHLFCQTIRSWGIDDGVTPSVLDSQLSENELRDPPWSSECRIAEVWNDIPNSYAARPETWVRINLEMIEHGKINSSFLAYNGTSESGLARVRKSLKQTNGKVVDQCVRSVLRHLGGIPQDRANRTAFLDCPLAKTWWRHKYAVEAHEVFKRTSVRVISDALRPSFRWTNLVEAMISKLTVIGDASIRPALIENLAEGAGDSADDFNQLLNWIGRRSTVQALGYLGTDYVFQLLHDQFKQEKVSKT